MASQNFSNAIVLLSCLSRLNKPAFNESINQYKESNKMNNDSRYFIAMSDGKTNLEVNSKQFNEIKSAMEKNEKFYELIQNGKDTTTKMNINLSNVIALNEKVDTNEVVASRISPEERDEIIKAAVESEEGCQALIESIASLISAGLEHQSLSRQILTTDPNNKLEYKKFNFLLKAPKDLYSPFVQVNEDKTISFFESKKDFYKPKFFTIDSQSSISPVNFEKIDMAQVNMKSDISMQEDSLLFSALEKAAELSGNIINSKYSTLLCPKEQDCDINDAFAAIEKSRLVVSTIILNSFRFADIRSWGKVYFDLETQREVLMKGIFGHLWNSDIFISNLVPDNHVYVLARSEFLGHFSVKNEVSVEKLSHSEDFLEVKSSEEIGISISNVNGVCLIKLAN